MIVEGTGRTEDLLDAALVGLGSNLGDCPRLIREAMERLRTLSVRPLRSSSLWSSSPADCPAGSPMFVNAVAALWPFPGETAESLLARLQALEREFGRLPKRILNEPRRLDLDLIAFRREIWETPGLVLPHPRACQRRFVLQPLCEIAPQWVFPGRDLTASQALEKAPIDPLLRRLE